MIKRFALLFGLCMAFLCLQHTNAFISESQNQRIISLAPAITEILYSLGLEDEIVGVTTFCNYPPQVAKKEKVGTFSEPDIEKIILLKPDLICATGLEQRAIVNRLRQLKLNVYVSHPSSIGELCQSIQDIGSLTHRVKEAHILVNNMKERILGIKDKVKRIPLTKREKVFVEIWHDPLTTAGKGSFIDELIAMAGGINIAHDVPRPYSYFSSEQLIKRNPDVIILGHGGHKAEAMKVRRRLGWSNITAVKNNSIYNDIEPDLFLRPGPRLVEGLEKIHRRLYP